MTTTMTKEMMEINEIITNISRKYSRKSTIPESDFSQDLWVKYLELSQSVSEIRIIVSSLVNKAIDMVRHNLKENEKQHFLANANAIDGVSFDKEGNSSGDYYLYEESGDYNGRVTNNDQSMEVEVVMMLDTLPEKAYRYAVAKAYLNAGLEFLRDRYFVIFDDLDNDSRDTLDMFEGRYTDDVILKVFCGIKSGTNSGSARVIKKTVKDLFNC